MKRGVIGVMLVLVWSVSACQWMSGLDHLKADGKLDQAVRVDAGAERGTDTGAFDAGMPGAEEPAMWPQTHDAGGAAGRGATTIPERNAHVTHDDDAGAADGGKTNNAEANCKPPIEGGRCDPVAQCGCSANENCQFSSEDKVVCYAAGDVEPYHACTKTQDCGVGYRCSWGNCQRACGSEKDTSCPGDGSECIQLYSGGIQSTPIGGGYLCTRTCNPAHPEQDDDEFKGCGPGLQCIVVRNAPTTVDCYQGGSSSEGAACDSDWKCAPGLWCSPKEFVCRRVCKVGGADCKDNESCQPLASHVTVGHGSEFGLCEGACLPLPGAAPGSSCNVVTQCGCPEHQACQVVNSSGLAACVPEGKVTALLPCSAAFDCMQGYTCQDGVCKRYCEGLESTRCSCKPVLDGQTSVPGHFACELCNPADPFTKSGPFAACAQGQACAPTIDTFACVAEKGNGMQGDVCMGPPLTPEPAQCAPDSQCISNKCTKVCQVGGSTNTCGTGKCTSFDTPAQIANIEIGRCQ